VHYDDGENRSQTKHRAVKAINYSAHNRKRGYGSRVTAGHSTVTNKTVEGESFVNNGTDNALKNLRDYPGTSGYNENGIGDYIHQNVHFFKAPFKINTYIVILTSF
jgi:hypothetical protein